MDWQSTLEKVDQILDEEQRFPTVSYVPAEPSPSQSKDNTSAFLEALSVTLVKVGNLQELQRLRGEQPRGIVEDTRRYRFKSSNYNLLRSLLSMLPEQSRLDLVRHTLMRVVSPTACAFSQTASYPAWNGIISELPLVAEFIVRNGCKESLIRVLAEAAPSLAHVLMLRQLEDMISLEFTLFTSAEYDQLSRSVSLFGQTARRQSEEGVTTKLMRQRPSDYSLPRPPKMLDAIISTCEGLVEQCRKARFLYVKTELEEGLNLEVNQDKDAVVSYLERSGFSNPLIESLNEAERLYRGHATAFDLKSGMGHLRSFMENLHAQAVLRICALMKISKPPPEQWSAQLNLLRETNVLSRQEHQLVSGLWAVISDEAVHSLIAEREYARLARNIVIEYALLFLKKLEKIGFQKP